MHQYAGNPALFPPNVGLVDDADLNPATAASLDVSGTNLADRTAYLFQRIQPLGGLNWREIVSGFTPTTGGGGNPVAGLNCVFWDFVNQIWIVPFIDGNFPTVDGGVPLSTSGFDITADQWYQFGGSSGPTYPALSNNDFFASLTVAPNGTTYLTAVVAPGATRTKILAMTPAGGAPTSVLTFPGSSTITTCNMINGASTIGGNAVVVAGFGSTDTANTQIWFSSDPGATVWNSQAVGTVIGTGCELLTKSGPIGGTPGFMVIPLIAAVFEPAVQFAYWTSTTGLSWTQRSLSGVIATNEVPQGLCYGADGIGPCWILATTVSNTQSNFYRSSDGLAWTFVASTTTRLVQDLTCIGNLWVASVLDAGTGSFPGGIWGTVANPIYGAAGASYTIFSIDGAKTWRRSQGILSKNLTSGSRQQRAKVATSNQQFCLYNSLQLRFSDAVTAVTFT